MFNGYNETPLISYNEFSQDRVDKKPENVSKWSYGHEAGPQPAQANRSADFWPGKANFIGVPNVVKCNCTGYYSTSESQSYQGENTRHRPWLPRSFPVPINGSNDSCKLPSYQWDGLSNQSTCYTEGSLPYVQEHGEKYSYYRHYQNPKLAEPNQPGVITSVKEIEYGKKTKNDMQNGRQTVYSTGYKRNHCDPNGTSYSLDRLPVEPFTKAVPSNLSQNRVPLTGYRSVKESIYDTGYDVRKTCPESGINSTTSQVHMDYSHFAETEPKFLFDNTRHLDYYSRNYPEVMKRNQTLESRKDCAVICPTSSEIHFNSTRYKPYDSFEKTEADYGNCFQDEKNENLNVHARLPRSPLLFNDPRYAEKTQNPTSYQTNQTVYKNFPYQGNNPQPRYDYPGGFQRTETNQYRPCQQMQSCEFASPCGGFAYNPQNLQKTQEFSTPVQSDPLISENPKPNYLEAIRSEGIKNGTSKISPLRLLRKKKFINVPQEPSVTTMDAPPGLDVRKFWSTWAEEEEENVAPTEMVVLDCQNIDPEQAKLLHLYDDPSRPVSLENIVIKNAKELEEIKIPEEVETVPEPVSSPVKLLKKGKSEHREKKKTETMDKWTEKKFDFLKRAEESKAAEILRHEEEKKKIFETRLSLQQTWKKPEKQDKVPTGGENAADTLSPFDENSCSDSPEVGTAGDLPTCEYRRNKFLDYSERKIPFESVSLNDSDAKVKEEVFEMDDILRKMSEINVESPGTKLETETNEIKKLKRKTKKKKVEPDKDKMTVETVAKPTIKFSIQKSHDLKISFKVLNEEEKNSEDKNEVEESKNSTEMITLKYKSIQREGDRTEGRKARKGSRRKKQLKAPVLKIKKSRHVQEEEKDPLAENENPINPEFSTSDDFQVQETVDSAKIKLTFKRHKGTLETECKVNGSNVEKVGEVNPTVNGDLERCWKKFKKPKDTDALEEEDIEPLPPCSDLQGIPDNQIINNIEDKPDSPTSPDKSTGFTEKEDAVEIPIGNKEEKRDRMETTESDDGFSNGNSENVREISLDFIKSTNSPEIETNHKTSKTEENSDVENKILENSLGSKSPNWRKNSEGGKNVGPSLLDFENQKCDSDKNSLPSNVTLNEGWDSLVGDDFLPVNGVTDEPNNRSNAHDSAIECEKNFKSEFEKHDLEDHLTAEVPIYSTTFGFEKEFPENDVSVDNKIECHECLKDFNKAGLPDFEKEECSSVEHETFKDPTKLELADFEKETDSNTDVIAEERDDNTPKNELSGSPNNLSADVSTEIKRMESDEDFAKAELRYVKEEDGLEISVDLISSEAIGSQHVEKVELSEDVFNAEVLIDSESDGPNLNLTQLNLEKELSHVVVSVEPLSNKNQSKFELSGFEREKHPGSGLNARVSVENSNFTELSVRENEELLKSDNAKVSVDCDNTSKEELFDLENEKNLPKTPSSLPDPCNNSGCDKTTENHAQSELEDGEIVDSSDESVPEKEQKGLSTNRRKTEFILRKIKRRNSSEQITWSIRKFSKAKSCPPEITFSNVPVENIPLPFGPPPRESCWEAKEKPSIFRQPDSPFCQSPFGLSDLQNCRNPSPPGNEHSGIFPGSSKIKFSILKRNNFSKPTPTEKIRTPECQEVPNASIKPVELSEDLDNIEVIDGMTEFYECEDIPTSEDLTNGDDLEIEKVNDDKFRNIMQNCLDNAKKFLTVGNLFSCSVEDFLELDSQSETEKSANHISRDVLLTSFEDTNEDLGLSGDVHPFSKPLDLSMDFVPSDVCPEILPVDNWPYLEEEVPSSPIRSKVDETDLIVELENAPKKSGRKRVVSETDLKSRTVSAKIATQRRKTIGTFTEASYGRDVKNEILRFKNEIKKSSFKCRLSLEKLSGKRSRKSVDYKSPSWQPKVMLCRISKNELRKTMNLANPQKKNESALEKPKPKYVTNTDADRKRKKSRFRNLYTKRKNKPEGTLTQHTKLVDAETVLAEKLKKLDPVSSKKGDAPKPVESQSNARSHGKEIKFREIKKNDHREKKKEKDEEKDKHREGDRKHGKSKRKSEEEEHKGRRGDGWACEVCGFNNESERIVHIRSHPFHCQSCHLAFKTEAHFIRHLTKRHKDIRNQHHCLLCELSFDTEEEYQRHLETREHTHLESVEKNTINTLFTLLTGAPCPVLGPVEMKPEWLPNQSGTVHFYHQATPLSLALQYLKMHHLSNFLKSSNS